MVGWLLKQESTRDVDTVIDINLDEEDARASIRCPLCEWQPNESEPMVLRTHAVTGRLLRWMRHRVEHVFDTRTLSGLSVPVALDELSAVHRLVAP